MKNSEKILLALLLVLAIGSGLAYRQLTQEMKAITSELVTEHSQQEGFYFNGELLGAKAIQVFEDKPYISYHFVKEFIDPSLELSGTGQRVYIPIDSKTLDLGDETLNNYLKEHLVDINIPLYQGEFMPLEILSRVYFFEYGQAGNYWYLLTQDRLMEGTISGNLYINQNLNIAGGSIKAPLEARGVALGEGVFVVAGDVLGFVKGKDFEKSPGEPRYFSRLSFRENSSLDGPIYLVWDQVNSYEEAVNHDKELVEESADVISPTLLALNINGIVINSGELTYTEWAHGRDKRVWVLVSNSFNPDWTREMLQDKALRSRFISQLVLLSLIYEYDGINIDFENIYLEDRELLNDFVKEVSEIIGRTGLPLSMDFTVPEGSDQWSKVYDRQTLVEYLDYFILMAYDEFWASSEVSGPVASLPWTLEGIVKTLEMVPADKLILGVPGYMRVWEDVGASNTSKTLTIRNLDDYLGQRDFELTYLEDVSMNYASRREGNVLYQIWIEDEISMGKRLELVREFNLPGIALWRRGFIDEQMEHFIQENLHEE